MTAPEAARFGNRGTDPGQCRRSRLPLGRHAPSSPLQRSGTQGWSRGPSAAGSRPERPPEVGPPVPRIARLAGWLAPLLPAACSAAGRAGSGKSPRLGRLAFSRCPQRLRFWLLERRDSQARQGSLVACKVEQTERGPGVQATALLLASPRAGADVGQILEGRRGAWLHGLDQALGQHMVTVPAETLLAAGHLAQVPLGRPCLSPEEPGAGGTIAPRLRASGERQGTAHALSRRGRRHRGQRRSSRAAPRQSRPARRRREVTRGPIRRSKPGVSDGRAGI